MTRQPGQQFPDSSRHANDAAFSRWADQKLAAYGRFKPDVIEINNPNAPSPAERTALCTELTRWNSAVYYYDEIRFPCEAHEIPPCFELSRRLGLHNPIMGAENPSRGTASGASDRSQYVCAITPSAREHLPRYIPFSTRSLNWHTDGYYFADANKVRAFTLHCHTAAESGGENTLMDHEILYLLLYQADPKYVSELSRDDAFAIPVNDHDFDRYSRNQFVGSVFSREENGSIHVRYTQRKHNIRWRETPLVAAARQKIRQILDSQSALQRRIKLESGQGVICNNVLHRRSAFPVNDGTNNPRHLSRIRFHDRISNT